METKHTPTPWARSDIGEIIGANGQRVWATSRFVHPFTINREEAARNDEFIFRACNSYEQLVAALKYAKMRLELADEDRFDKTTLQQINDALKAAGAA